MKCDRLKLLEFVKFSWRLRLSIGEAAQSSFWSSSRSLGDFGYQLEKQLNQASGVHQDLLENLRINWRSHWKKHNG
jgi:hypothetical protein